MMISLSDLYQKSVLKNYIHISKKSTNPGLQSINIQINHPLLEFLSSSEHNGSCVTDLGKLSIFKQLDELELNLSESTLYTLITHDEELYKEIVLNDFEIKISADMPNVVCQIPSICLSSSLSQIKFIHKILYDYIGKLKQFQNFIVEINKSEQNEEKFEFVERLAHGTHHLSESLNLTILLEKVNLLWYIKTLSEIESRDFIQFSCSLSNIHLNIIKKQTSI